MSKFISWEWNWSLYAYRGGEVPGIEDGGAVNVFTAALHDVQSVHGPTTEAGINLNELLDELIRTGKYAINDAGTEWQDPRKVRLPIIL